MIQIDGIRRQLFVEFTAFSYIQDILHRTNKRTVYKHNCGEISTVRLEIAGMGTHRIRLANQPPEIPETPYELHCPNTGKFNPS
jgi:hypothetical protein